MKSIFVFEDINITILFKIFLFFRKDKIFILLEKSNFLKKFYILILNILSIHIYLIEDFYAGDIKRNNQAITLEAYNHTNKSVSLILKKIQKFIFKEKFINNKEHDYSKLYVAKLLISELNLLYVKYFIIEHFVPGKKKIFLKQFNFLNEHLLSDIQYLNEIKFQKNKFFLLYFFLNLFKDIFEYIWALLLNIFSKKIKIDFKKSKNILTFQYGTVSLNKSLRSQPYWLDTNEAIKKNYNLFIIKNCNFLKSKSIPKILEKEKLLNEKNIYILPSNLIFKYNSFFLVVKNFVKYFSCFDQKNICNKYLKLKLIIFLNYTSYLKNFLKINNFNLVVLEENYLLSSDAACLASSELGIKSISIQYSNLGILSIPMIAICDLQLVFSKSFKKIYKFENLSPKKFYEVGDIFISNQKNLLQRSNKTKENFSSKGVKFVICYFDERIDFSKFGNNSFESNQRELNHLFKYVLNDNSVGLITKSQFIRYSLSRLYKSNVLLSDLIKTGRYIELEKGEVGIGRNDILPIEAASSADVCLSQKFGATAGLNSAVIMKKTILLNRHGYKTVHDHIYEKSTNNICFEDINEALKEIKKLQHSTEVNVGDWNEILPYFYPFKDRLAKERVMSIIGNELDKCK